MRRAIFIFLILSNWSWASQECLDKYNLGLHSRFAAGGLYDKGGEIYSKAEKQKNLKLKKTQYLSILEWSQKAIVRFSISNEELKESLKVCPSDTHSAINSIMENNNSDIGIIRGFMLKINDKLNTVEMQKIDN